MVITPSTTIEELLNAHKICVRTYNVCRASAAKLYTVRDLIRFNKSNPSFITLKNCGRKSNAELLKIIALVDSEPEYVEYFDNLPNSLKQIFINEYELYIDNPNKISIFIDTFKALFPTFKYFLYAFYKSPVGIFQSNNLYKIKNNKDRYIFCKEILDVYSSILRQIEKYFSDLDLIVGDSQNSMLILRDSFIQLYSIDQIKYELPAIRITYLESEYANLVSAASARAKSLQENGLKTFFDLIPYLTYSIDEFSTHFGYKKKSSKDFYNQVLLPFLQSYNTALSKNTLDEDIRISLKFRNLGGDTIEFIKNFVSQYQYYPLFYILYFNLTTSDMREIQMYCMSFGLNNSQKSYSLSEVAYSFSLSRERVRQIISKFDVLKFCSIEKSEWLKYFEKAPAFITPESVFFSSISSRENCIISFEAFADVASRTGIYSYDENLNVICLKTISHSIISAYKILQELKLTKFSEDTVVNPKDIFNKTIYENEVIMNIIHKEVLPYLHIEVRKSSLFFPQNHIDVIKEVYDFLYDLGEPAHIEKIHAFLSNKYPDLQLTPLSLKFKLRNSPEIMSIGKTSMFKLSHWRNFFGGNIRDLLRKILNESNIPLHIDTITDIVTDSFDTNKKSIHSSLLGCNDFQTYSGGLFGLTGKIYPEEFVIVDLSKTRSTFDERFTEFQNFVTEYNRLPYASGIYEEESLKRWQVNVFKRILDVSDEQVESLENFINQNSHLPSNGIEVNFYLTCSEYLDFVNNNFELPTRSTNSSLYYWFLKHRIAYHEYQDNRKRFFQSLIDELADYGFV